MIELNVFKQRLGEKEDAFPLLTLDEFFNGNLEEDSIAPNQWGYGRPPLAEMWGVLQRLEGMPGVAWVGVALHCDTAITKERGTEVLHLAGDTIVVCTITGLCIASSGVLGSTDTVSAGNYYYEASQDAGGTLKFSLEADGKTTTANYSIADLGYHAKTGEHFMKLEKEGEDMTLVMEDRVGRQFTDAASFRGTWKDETGNEYVFSKNGSLEYRELVVGSALTISAFKTILGEPGGWLVCIAIALFAFSTILGWEYHGEKAFEYLLNTHKYNMAYRIFFSLMVYAGATTALDLVWNLSDIANALMAVPNLICLLALSGEIANDVKKFRKS